MAGIYTSLQDALYAVTTVALSEYPTTAVIFSHEDGSEPAGPYVTISILSVEQQGQYTGSALANLVAAQYEVNVTTANEVLCQFSFVGSDSGDQAYSFQQRINNNPLVFDELARNKLGVMRKSQVRRAPQKRDTQWVEYHNLDVTFSYHVVTKLVVDIVEGIVAEGIYDDTIHDPFTVPENLVINP